MLISITSTLISETDMTSVYEVHDNWSIHMFMMQRKKIYSKPLGPALSNHSTCRTKGRNNQDKRWNSWHWISLVTRYRRVHLKPDPAPLFASVSLLSFREIFLVCSAASREPTLFVTAKCYSRPCATVRQKDSHNAKVDSKSMANLLSHLHFRSRTSTPKSAWLCCSWWFHHSNFGHRREHTTDLVLFSPNLLWLPCYRPNFSFLAGHRCFPKKKTHTGIPRWPVVTGSPSLAQQGKSALSQILGLKRETRSIRWLKDTDAIFL